MIGAYFINLLGPFSKLLFLIFFLLLIFLFFTQRSISFDFLLMNKLIHLNHDKKVHDCCIIEHDCLIQTYV